MCSLLFYSRCSMQWNTACLWAFISEAESHMKSFRAPHSWNSDPGRSFPCVPSVPCCSTDPECSCMSCFWPPQVLPFSHSNDWPTKIKIQKQWCLLTTTTTTKKGFNRLVLRIRMKPCSASCSLWATSPTTSQDTKQMYPGCWLGAKVVEWTFPGYPNSWKKKNLMRTFFCCTLPHMKPFSLYNILSQLIFEFEYLGY